MARTDHIELGTRKDPLRIPILYEDRSVLAIDKPAGWMLVPFNWQRTPWNLQAALTSGIRAGYFWAKSRNLKFLKYIHRLDSETTGILLFGKSPGVVETYGRLFERRRVGKRYLAVVEGKPVASDWSCAAPLMQDPDHIGRMLVQGTRGKPSFTKFHVLASHRGQSLIEACPETGRTHQIRVHLKETGHPIVGDPLYGSSSSTGVKRSQPGFPMGLRAVGLRYRDPFRRREVHIEAETKAFLEAFGFDEPRMDKDVRG